METRQKKAKVVVSVVALAGLLAFALTAIGGNLEPSAPPGPTMKTLDEVEPRIPVQSLGGDANSLYVISQPGSYYLTGNITGEPNKDGIMIAANNVTVDLMGFSLIGVPCSGRGIVKVIDQASPQLHSYPIRVRNGTICNWGGDGMYFEEIKVTYNGGSGVGTSGMLSPKVLMPCHLYLEGLSVYNNGSDGVRLHNALAHMEDVSFCSNGANGIDADDGFLKIDGGNVSNNGANGLVVDGNSCCHLEDVAFTYNTGHGAVVGVYGMLDAFGVLAPHNGGGGIIAGGSGNLKQCTVVGNGGSGIEVGTGSTVRNCSARGNTGDVSGELSWWSLKGNTCESNGVGVVGTTDPAGIRATGVANRIEANHVISNNIGIGVDAAGNLIIKNSAQGNSTNYDIALGNTAGPTLGTGDIVSDNPHANYEF